MATRNPSRMKVLSKKKTEFQLHTNHTSLFDGIRHKIFDFTEYKLARYANGMLDHRVKLEYMSLLSDYINGHIVVAWQQGVPVYIKITKG